MKVKELIEYLQTLDQEKGIWVFYDGGCSVFPPVPDALVDEGDMPVVEYDHLDCKIGDYKIIAG